VDGVGVEADEAVENFVVIEVEGVMLRRMYDFKWS
jgi:hypothetical protein